MSALDPYPSYTVFIRLPFSRGDFEDPPAVEWDATKDKALWKILSKASKNSDIDWAELATRFQVTLAFLLQQAAWLYERQLLQVRAQMRKAGMSKGSLTPSPVPGSTSETPGGESMRKTGSGGAGPKAAPALSSRKDSPVPKGEGSLPIGAGRTPAPTSRAPSSNTTAVLKNASPSASSKVTSGVAPPRRSLSPNPRSRRPSLAVSPQASKPAQTKTEASPTMSSSSPSSASFSSDSGPAQSRLLRRPRFMSKKLGQSGDADVDDDEEEDEGPAFMPLAGDVAKEISAPDPSATLRGDPRGASRRLQSYTHPQSQAHKNRGINLAPTYRSQTSDSSSSSAPQNLSHSPLRPTGPLSPRRTTELAGRNPGVFKGKGREGSESSPSMGSSFSDLEDASVTQSALEEALASNMPAGGGMASRMSTISQALRSRYL